VILFAFLDAILPVVPSETAVITAGVVASGGRLSLPLIILAAAVGATLGDDTAYLIGRRFGVAVVNRFLNGETERAPITWAKGKLATEVVS
jgi:membrane-associated protein